MRERRWVCFRVGIDVAEYYTVLQAPSLPPLLKHSIRVPRHDSISLLYIITQHKRCAFSLFSSLALDYL